VLTEVRFGNLSPSYRFEAALRGNWRRIDKDELPANLSHLAWYLCVPRNPEQGPYNPQDFQNDFNRLCSELDFDIGSGWMYNFTGNRYSRTRGGVFILAHTANLHTIGKTRIQLSHELLIPLRRKDLSIAEKLLDVYRITHVLLHEIAVSL
jgi:hypothetical protein